MSDPLSFFATAPRGVSRLLAAELADLGAADCRTSGAGVAFTGDLVLAYRVCLWSRLANRVLMPLLRFEAPDPERLYAAVHGFAWEEHLASTGTLAVDCTAVNSPIGHTRYAALKVKDAIVDRFRERTGERPSVDVERPDLRLNLHLRGTSARLALDLSGGSLHRRGYRSDGAAAPLKENLAAALLLLAQWPRLAAAGGGLFDPMCGSGTLLLEGALMAADAAPGLTRGQFGFLGWHGHQPRLWQDLLEEARQRRTAGLERLGPILGQDSAAAAVEAARANVARAGLDEHIVILQRALHERPARLPAQGLLITNPPYGERLGEVNALRETYAELGEQLRTLPQWSGAVFTGNPELGGFVGLTPSHAETLFNGPIECRLLHFPAAGERAAAPVAAAAAPELVNRLRKNLKHLGRWARRTGVQCWRLYDQDLPEYALAVDLYHGERLWVHVQEYQAPASVDPDKAAARLDAAIAALAEVLEVAPGQVFLKRRQRQRGRAQYGKQDELGRLHPVQEDGVRLLVNFTDYLDTGLFLDHRPLRRLLRERAAGKRFLNLFCYTGSATVHAAAGGAAATTSVDLSRTYLEWARRNLAANQRDAGQELIQADCRHWLAQEARRGRRRYDLILLDPPTFSTSKRMQGTFDVQRDHVELIRNAAALLAPGGELYFSNNFRRFRLDEAALAGFTVEDITRATIDEDFKRHPHVHRCWRIAAPG